MNMTTNLKVSVVQHPPTGLDVRIKQEHGDPQGRTSVRFFTNDARKLKPRKYSTDPPPGTFYTRDRDLGQTFTTPAGEPFRLKAITLRTGPADDADGFAVGADAPGAAVSLQFFAVHGTPIHHDNNTPHEYISGEAYESLGVVTGGTLPGELQKNQWLRWELTGDDAIVLQPATKYAFLVMFDEPAAHRELALANRNPVLSHMPVHDFGGHGIRREGSVAEPWLDPSWINNREASSLPLDRARRLEQQPGTFGRPDVDTFRALTFYLEGVSVPEADAGQVETAIAAIIKAGGRITRDESRPSKPVVSVILSGETVDNAIFASLQVLTRLQELVLHNSLRITDTGLAHLRRLTKLQKLDLSGTGITEAGLANLEGLIEIRELNLSATSFGLSAGEVHLNKLTKLQTLDLSASGVRVASLKFGNALTNLQNLNLADAQITDDSLANLEGLTGLRNLNIGVDFPGLVTDAGLKHLKRLTNLQELNLVNQMVTKVGIEELQQALAHTRILDNISR
jgi:hypothetical protein